MRKIGKNRSEQRELARNVSSRALPNAWVLLYIYRDYVCMHVPGVSFKTCLGLGATEKLYILEL